MTDRWQDDPIIKPSANAGWQQDPIVRQGGGGIGGFAKGFAQGAARDVQSLGELVWPGGPAAARAADRWLGEHDPTGISKRVSQWIDEPSTSTAQTAGQFTGGFAPALIPGPSELTLLSRGTKLLARPLAHLATHYLAHKVGGPVVHRGLHKSGLLGMAAQWAAGHLEPLMEDFGRGLERVGLGGLAGTQATKEPRDDKEREPRSETREPPAKPSQSPARRSREADDRGNRPTAAERFDRRWSALGDLQSAQSEERETR